MAGLLLGVGLQAHPGPPLWEGPRSAALLTWVMAGEHCRALLLWFLLPVCGGPLCRSGYDEVQGPSVLADLGDCCQDRDGSPAPV